MLQSKKWSMEWAGRTLSVEVGKLALQADASAVIQYGETVILGTVIVGKTPKLDLDFLPLFVEFEEKLYAAGKIKGSRFMKREGRPSDEAILSGRVVDRAIRPLFDKRLRTEVQVVLTPLAIDGENDATIPALLAASCALNLSSVPWEGPIGAARVGRINDQYVLNVTSTQLEAESNLNLVVAGTPEKLVMVEAGAKEVSEDDMFEAIQWGSQELAPVIEFFNNIRKEIGKEKMNIEEMLSPAPAEGMPSREELMKMAEEVIFANADTLVYNTPKVSKAERNATIDLLKAKVKEAFLEKGYEEVVFGSVMSQIKSIFAKLVTARILEKKQRLDGRDVKGIRELNIEIDMLPRVHGSGMFMRGDTQVLSIVTLGAPGDVQTLDTMEEEGTKRYMHHYNDAPYTYGEVGPMRGPGRRAIGHGALAEKAIVPVLPPETEFPYAIRVVSEVLGSNGSSSMASTCGSTLSLMAAGVPIKKPVAGIAMGLASNEKGDWQVITDLQDVEDGEGGMDFKIAGTHDGITAIQMDTKTKGLNWDIVRQTLTQAREARVEILAEMAKVIAEPRKELSPYAPRIETIQIDPEKIGDLIGPGGKTIKKIIEETGVDIDIEQDGRVMITSNDATAMAAARAKVMEITKEITAGEVYEGKVVRLEDFGAFVSLTPNKDGLVHVSEISYERVAKPGDVLKLGDMVKVKVKEIDNMGRVNLSIKALLTKPEGYVEPERRPMGGGNRGGFNRGGDRGPRRPFNNIRGGNQ